MYEYSFEHVSHSAFGKPQSDYRDIVRIRAAEGWRLAHVVELRSPMSGIPTLQLIFERPASAPQDAMRTDYPAPPQRWV